MEAGDALSFVQILLADDIAERNRLFAGQMRQLKLRLVKENMWSSTVAVTHMQELAIDEFKARQGLILQTWQRALSTLDAMNRTLLLPQAVHNAAQALVADQDYLEKVVTCQPVGGLPNPTGFLDDTCSLATRRLQAELGPLDTESKDMPTDQHCLRTYIVACVFLSHSSRDKPLARQIANDLRKANIDVWLDEWEILVGDSITQRIQCGLKEANFVAVLLTKHSVESGWVEKEWQSQVGIEAATRQVIILPLKAENCSIPVLLRDKKYADFQSDYTEAVNRLIEAVKGHASRRERASAGQKIKGRGQEWVLQAKTSTDVLIVEDDLSFAHALSFFLKGLGHSAAIASDERAAIELAKRYRPKNVVFDLGWLASGYFNESMIRHLREILPNARFVGLTPHIAEDQSASSLVDVVVTKPAKADEIRRALDLRP